MRYSSIAPGRISMFAALILLAAISSASAQSVELLMNGGFENALHPWKTNPAHGNWNPLASQPGQVNLHPDRPGQRGDVVYQNLNVTGIGGATVSAQVQLRASHSPGGRGVGVYLEYIDNSDMRQRVRLLNPDNSALATNFLTFSNSFTFPADAVRLVKFSAAKEGDGQFYGDNFSLMAAGLTVNPVPNINHVDPACGPYGTIVNIAGSDFGNVAGTVLFGEVPGAVQTWNDTNITARVDAPAVTGRVTVIDDNHVENHGVPPFSVTSPYITGYPVRAHQRVIKGEVAEFLVSIEFRNGFASAAGVSLSVPQLGAGAMFSPAPLKASGGGLISIPTTNLNAGVHHWTVRASDGVHPPLDFPISLEIVTITNIAFTTRDESFMTIPLSNPHSVTNQGPLVIGAKFTDSNGTEIDDFQAEYDVSSSNPGVVLIYHDNFGGLNYEAVNNGTSVLTFTTPDGTSSNLTVNVNFPGSGTITSIGLGSSSMDNAGMTTNTFFAMSDVAINLIGRPNQISNVMSSFSADNKTYNSEFIALPGATPGTYALTADAGGSRSAALLTITNAGNRGEIRGDVYTLNGQFYHGPVGTIKYYDAVSGSLVFSNMLEVGFVGSEYTKSYLPPGNYKIKLEVDPFLPFQSEQWFPNANSMAQAQTVSVTAGGVVTDVDWFLNGPITTTLPEALEFCPPDLFSSGNNEIMWYGQLGMSHDGQDSARSPSLNDNQLSFIETTLIGPGNLSFWWKVSSETNADFLSFEMNFSLVTNISGEVDWTQVTVPIPDGATTVSWTYQKDTNGAAGLDAGWLDQVMFTATAGTPPAITQQPQSRTVIAGTNVLFSVTASGSGLMYQWQKNGADLSGQTAMSLTLNSVQPADAGAYRVIVSNSHGSVTSAPANLTIVLPPMIDTHPMNQTVGLNGATMLSVVASGSGPFTYQWKLNGTDLPGETAATLNISMLAPASAGVYSVVVSGPGGSVTSQPATLTVIDLAMYAGVTIFGRVGDQYRIEYANSLNSPNWTLAETITLPTSPYRWFDIDSPNHPMRYYRAILLPPQP